MEARYTCTVLINQINSIELRLHGYTCDNFEGVSVYCDRLCKENIWTHSLMKSAKFWRLLFIDRGITHLTAKKPRTMIGLSKTGPKPRGCFVLFLLLGFLCCSSLCCAAQRKQYSYIFPLFVTSIGRKRGSHYILSPSSSSYAAGSTLQS